MSKENKKIADMLNDLYFEAHKQKIGLEGYYYVMNFSNYIKLRKESFICSPLNVNAPKFNNIPIYIDDTLSNETIYLRKNSSRVFHGLLPNIKIESNLIKIK